MASLHVKRAGKELKQLQAVAGTAEFPALLAVSLPNDDDILAWRCKLRGPEGSLYAGGLFDMSIVITPEYPNRPPQLRFITKVWHPSVNAEDGRLCEELFADWAPANTVRDALAKVLGVLVDVESAGVLNADAKREAQENRKAFEASVAKYLKKYAM